MTTGGFTANQLLEEESLLKLPSIKNSDAVISVPFTSIGVIAETMNVKSIYYDPSGKINSGLKFK